ncbi:ArnT family glycosyltransferase [Actinospica robiniae]|uniref:ArnT family glycosyltransferase n=1 Tax=Actinospica robiniae TaxID=304901 RepID=UPI0012FA4391|nr:phospholipid carrier-dependent glycosyltransferase [Actinospica robiniae]
MTLTEAVKAEREPRPSVGSRLAGRADALLDLGIVAAVGLALRLPAVGFGLPAMLHPDEPGNVVVGARMAVNSDWNPHYFAYPSVMYDVEAISVRAQGLVTGHMLNASDFTTQGMGINQTSDPDMVLFLRLITVALSVGLCLLVYGLVRHITGRRWVAVGCGLLGATSPLLITNGVFITPDTYSAFFSTATLAGALAVVRRGKRLDYVLAGLAVGLAWGSKYDIVCSVPVIVAYLIREGRNAYRPSALLSLGTAALAAVVSFVVSTPAALFDTSSLITGLRAELSHYATGHPGAQGGAFEYYLSALSHDQFLLIPGALLAVVAAWFGHFRKETVVVGAYSLGYFGLIASETVRFDRDLLPLLPGLMLLTGFGVAWIAQLVAERRPALPRPAGFAVVTALAAAMLVPAVMGAAGVPQTLDEAPRTEVAAWLDAHLPQGAAVVDEHYGPWLEPSRYHVTEVGYVVSEASLPAGQQAIILTDQGSGRFTDDPAQYPHEFAAYQALLKNYCLAVKYTNGPWAEVLTPCTSG